MEPTSISPYQNGNYHPDSVQGCYIAYLDAPWLICDVFDPDELGLAPGDNVPDFTIDPDDHTLSVINSSSHLRSYYITLSHRVRRVGRTGGRNNKKFFKMGETTDEHGKVKKCVTFVLVVKPGYVMDVCEVEMPSNEDEELDLYSHVSDVAEHTEPDRFIERCLYMFPLGGSLEYLCTQGEMGHFTHFSSGTHHAIDFRCPIGTPVLAIADGEVIEVNQHNTISGIHAKNLFCWNSIMLSLDDGFFVEYVHIKANSCTVKVGDRVIGGQTICQSGNVGFCPEPHLHIQMHQSRDPKAPTIKFGFMGDGDKKKGYFPIAGRRYSSKGPVSTKKK